MTRGEKWKTAWLLMLPVALSIGNVPINKHVAVKIFGCGCVHGFNANVFNFQIVMPFILILSGVLFIRCVRTCSNPWSLFLIVPALLLQQVVGFIAFRILTGVWV